MFGSGKIVILQDVQGAALSSEMVLMMLMVLTPFIVLKVNLLCEGETAGDAQLLGGPDAAHGPVVGASDDGSRFC